MMAALASFLGLGMGMALGVLGAGGSIAAVPIFAYVLGAGPKEAIAMSLAVVGATAAVGAWMHGRIGNVRLDVAVVFAPVAMVGTYLGARLAIFLSGETQLVLFAAVMLVAAFFMGRSAGAVPFERSPDEPSAEPGDRGRETAPPERRWAAVLLATEAFGVGVLTGVVGVGGGFLIVPALVLLAGVPMREAVGTSLLVIAFKSAAGFVGYLDQVAIDWLAMAIFTAGAVVGIFAGTRLGGRLPVAVLRRTFAAALVVMSVVILYVEGLG